MTGKSELDRCNMQRLFLRGATISGVDGIGNRDGGDIIIPLVHNLFGFRGAKTAIVHCPNVKYEALQC